MMPSLSIEALAKGRWGTCRNPARAFADAGSTIGKDQGEHQRDHRKFSRAVV
jgi:hypothetical protein